MPNSHTRLKKSGIMRQGDKNGKTTGKNDGDRRHMASKLCEILSGGYFDHHHIRYVEQVRYVSRFSNIRQKQERLSVKRAGDRKHSLEGILRKSIKYR